MSKLESHFSSGCWRSAADIDRPFVRYADCEASPGEVWRRRTLDSKVRLSVVIPTWDGYRDGYLPRLLDQIQCQDFSEFEILVVRGDPRQGRAINIAVALAQGEYLLTLDDDASLTDITTFGKLIAVLENDPDIGMAGATNIIPEDAKPFIKRVMKELPRRSSQSVSKITDSDLAEHGCLIMRTDEFKAVGGENELIPRGLDPYLREAYRKLNKRVVVVPGAMYHHLPPANLCKLLRQFYRNGSQAAFANRNYPQWVIETPSQHGAFKTHLPLSLRMVRFPIRLILALITGKPIWFLSEAFYALGFAREWIASAGFQRAGGKTIRQVNEG